MTSFPAADPAAELARIEALSRVIRTPCGSGTMVWREWGQGEPLILLHGGFGSWNHWVRNVEFLARHFRVVAADMPGQGDSDDPDHPFDADSLAAIVTEGVRQVVPGETPLRMMCFSFGSIIGGLVAAGLGERVLSYTGVGAAGLGDRGPTTQQMIRITPDMAADEQVRLRRHNLGILMFADAGNIDALADHIQEINMARNRIRSRPISLSDRLSRTFPLIKGRINLIWGSEDVTAVGFFEPRHAALKAIQPDAGIAMRDGVGHWVQYEDADWFNPVALDLLRGG
ncbi:alpha/beta fold hydrolase [Thalassobaculum litoreum]|uniref:Pimeloyl-ACP methyl ester carboxylesterase n=1 Tax=Thalassobaculum litoreum DSM 18839 TaxID=1123362 RepID=A0A8G2BLY3_9PROT|nr:alpha/beta fold hydrolase [Thalassobaculum litoreum]SDG46858.1 Pimeloyl-ACP methyl ester carboxylesterase [Thalassobaculum litoreum DSM 18839]